MRYASLSEGPRGLSLLTQLLIHSIRLCSRQSNFPRRDQYSRNCGCHSDPIFLTWGRFLQAKTAEKVRKSPETRARATRKTSEREAEGGVRAGNRGSYNSLRLAKQK